THPSPSATYTLSLHDALPISRKLYHHSGCLPRAVRIQPARSRKRFHHAERTGRAGRAIPASGRTGTGALTNGNSVHNLHSTGHRSEEHTSELQSLRHLVCRLL